MSPHIFNVYTDDLSNIGCRLVGRLINDIAYIDDVCILSMLPCGMQLLHNIYETYVSDHDIVYNSKKV